MKITKQVQKKLTKQTLKELRRKGLTYQQIGDKFKISSALTYYYFKKYNIVKRVHK